MNFPEKLQQKLNNRIKSNALRSLDSPTNLTDFYSNDYLGFAQSETIFEQSHQLLLKKNHKVNGATGSRLISGNHKLYEETERYIAKFHASEKALLYNSGYDANIGFFAAVPQRGDVILYDELIHASIRDGIQLSNAKAFKFKHNDIAHLTKQIESVKAKTSEHLAHVYIVTESVFSMDGDSPDLKQLVRVSKENNCYLIIDEAHAFGVFGENGSGLVQGLHLENDVFARIVTYGKGLGCHGAAILGSEQLYSFLVNFSRSLIYTTGLSPHAVATIQVGYEHLNTSIVQELQHNIAHFNQEVNRLQLRDFFIESHSAIHCCVLSSTNKTKKIAEQLQQKGFNVKPILAPTVPEGQERLRICLHRYNSTAEITAILAHLATFAL